MPLETGGGIFNALPLLGPGAVPGRERRYLDGFRFRARSRSDPGAHARLVLVPNPPQHAARGFRARGRLRRRARDTIAYTYSGIGVYTPRVLRRLRAAASFPLLPLLKRAIAARRLRGQVYRGDWSRHRLARAPRGARRRNAALPRSLRTSRRLSTGRDSASPYNRGHVRTERHPVVAGVPSRARARSGEKYVTPQGFTAIRDGIKSARRPIAAAASTAQAALAARQAPAGEGFSRRQEHRARASPRHGVRRSEVPEHRRMLERRHRHHHVDGRGLHARLPLLLGGYRQSARLARCRGAAERRPHRRADGPEVRRAHFGESRRSAGRRREALRGLHPRHQAAHARKPPSKRSRRISRACSRTSRRWSIQASKCSRRTSRRCGASRIRCAIRARATSRRCACSSMRSGTSPRVLTKTSLMLGLGETDEEIARDDGRPARHQRGHPHARPIPAADGESSAGAAFRHAGGVRSLSRVGARARLPRMRVRAARALELSCGAGAQSQQRGPRQQRARRRAA